MADIKTRAVEIESRLREQVLHHRDLSNPLYMSEHGRLLHEAANVIASLHSGCGAYVVAPAEASKSMLRAGVEAGADSQEQAGDVYEAMIKAHQEVMRG